MRKHWRKTTTKPDFPHFFYRELQAIENGETDPVIGPNSLDKERCLLNDDPKWLDTTYVLANYKTEPCKKPPRLCRQGYACPQFHNNKDKRRSPKKYKYRYNRRCEDNEILIWWNVYFLQIHSLSQCQVWRRVGRPCQLRGRWCLPILPYADWATVSSGNLQIYQM